MEKFDVLVLGGGLAGVSAALRVAELGGKVCLIEKGNIGRVGFYRRNTLFRIAEFPSCLLQVGMNTGRFWPQRLKNTVDL